MRRFTFYTRDRKPNEAVNDYVAALRKLAMECDFAGSLEDNLRDRLVCGINEVSVQRKMLTEPALDLKKAMQIAITAEATEKHVRELATARSHVEDDTAKGVNRILRAPVVRNTDTSASQNSTRGRRQTGACAHCGSYQHAGETCRLRDVRCHICNERGHIKRVCPRRGKCQRINELTSYSRDDEQNESKLDLAGDVSNIGYSCSKNADGGTAGGYVQEYDVLVCDTTTDERRPRRKVPKSITVNVKLNGKPVAMELDTGATVSLISRRTFESLWPNGGPSLRPTETTLRGYAGDNLEVLGEIDVDVELIESQQKTASREQLFVVDGSGHCLFGRNWLQTFRLKWPCLLAQINEVTSTDTSKKLEQLLEKHEEVFRAGLGTFSRPPVSIFVDADVVPKFCPARSVPYAWRGAVDSQLSRMEDAGIIESVAHAEWASPIVPMIKDDGTVRVVDGT